MTCQTRRGCRNRVLTGRSPCVRGLPHRARTSGHQDQGRERRRTPAAEASCVSVLIRRDATWMGAAHLVFPLEPGLDQLGPRLAGPADEERDRPFSGELALAGVAEAEAGEIRRASVEPLALR